MSARHATAARSSRQPRMRLAFRAPCAFFNSLSELNTLASFLVLKKTSNHHPSGNSLRNRLLLFNLKAISRPLQRSKTAAHGGRGEHRRYPTEIVPQCGDSGRCRRVPARSVQSRRQNVGSLADSEEVQPNAPPRQRPVQHQSGAPGWNRTSDTRFRKPVLYPLSYEGITPICRSFLLSRPDKNTTGTDAGPAAAADCGQLVSPTLVVGCGISRQAGGPPADQ